jgi:hypothetical protein
MEEFATMMAKYIAEKAGSLESHGPNVTKVIVGDSDYNLTFRPGNFVDISLEIDGFPY